jgi:hypothetical protein
MLALPTSIPDWPPSPPTDSNQELALPVKAHVPLSWVPPRRFLSGLFASTEML